MKTIAVIGGGITGITTAYALTLRGYAVTVFERHRYAAMETSYANGGQLSASNAETWNNWPTIFRALHWIFRRDAPLLINPKPSWHKLSWMAEFIAATRSYRANTTETARMAIAARDILYQWADNENIDFDLERRGILHIYRTRNGFEHAREVSAMLAAGGLQREPVAPADIRGIEPVLQGSFHGGFYTESDATGDIHKFTVGLAGAAERRGAQLRFGTEVKSLSSDDHSVAINLGAADSHAQREEFDGVVICAGTASRRFAAMLSERVNVYPVKGYSITVELNDEASRVGAPWVSILDDETKLVCSRLGADRLRVAGTAEFNGFNYDIRADRIEPLIEWVESCFPAVGTEYVVPWAGLRPMTPNMMPRVGRGQSPCVFFNTGHGHLGWTLAAVTAHSVAETIANTE